MFYAQINDAGRVIAVSQLSAVLTDPRLIPIEQLDVSLIGALYRDGQFVRPEEALTSADIDAERDRRIDAGFGFDGVLYQSRPDDRENIAGAVLIAIADPAYTTGWIAADNSVVQMDAPTLLHFGRTAADHKQALIFAARQLKDMQPIPADYADDKWWPAA